MTRSLRKGHGFVDAEYENGGYSTLHARDFIVRASEDGVVFSFDLSHNQRIKNKSANAYLDVQELIEKSSSLRSLELGREKWLDPLAQALKQHHTAPTLIEARFKDGQR